MGRIYRTMQELIGGTPLVEAGRLAEALDVRARLLVKMEYFNPTGSAKDRAASYMIEDAIRRGVLKPGSVIIEPTSGNTGIGLAAIGAVRGFQVILTMPETMSVERRNILKAYGAQVILTEGSRGMEGAVAKAREIAEQIPGSFLAGQFDNPANAAAHREMTGPEIWEDTDGHVDVFVATVGTGGTLTGVGEYLKKKNPAIQIVAVEPAASALLSKGQAGAHKIQGIGAGFIPSVLNREIYDRIETVEDQMAFEMARKFGNTEGMLVGISSGAALAAAVALGRMPEYAGKTIVALLPDSADRYYSTPLFG